MAPGAVVAVDVRFHFVHYPLHGGIACALYAAHPARIDVVRRIFPQPLVARVGTLHPYHDHLLGPSVEKGFQSPRLAVGGVLVVEEVVAVEHVEHGVALLRLSVAVGQVQVYRAHLPGGGVCQVELNYLAHLFGAGCGT